MIFNNRNGFLDSKPSKYRSLVLWGVLTVVVGSGWLFFREDITALLLFLKSGRAHPVLVISAFLVLPMLFFPISMLLVLLGLYFDLPIALAIMFASMPVHLSVAFVVVTFIFRNTAERLAHIRHRRILQIPESRLVQFGFLFMALPGLPYTVKNYLLPLSGIQFRSYLFIGWLVQGIMAVPFLMLGDAVAQWRVQMFAAFFLLFILFFFITRKVQKRYERLIESGGKECRSKNGYRGSSY